MAKAVALKPDPRFVVEFDEISEGAGVPAAERLAAFEKHPDAYHERDDAMSQLALNYLQAARRPPPGVLLANQ